MIFIKNNIDFNKNVFGIYIYIPSVILYQLAGI